MRALFLLPLVAAALLRAGPVGACPAMPGPDAIFPPLLAARDHLPKNLGLPFSIYVGANVTEAVVQARVHVTVTQSDVAVAGSLHQVENGIYFWRPDAGTLPIGTSTVNVQVDGDDSARTYAVTVDDRTLVPTAPPAHVEVTRQLEGDPTSPEILCNRPATPSTCGATGPFTQDLPSTVIAVPLLTVTVDTSDVDRVFLVEQATVFGREADGGAAPAVVLPPRLLSRVFDRTYDEYCVLVTTTVLGSAAAGVSQSLCTKGAIETAVTAAETTQLIDQEITGCSSVVYPSSDPGDAGAPGVDAGPGYDHVDSPGSPSADGGCSCKTTGRRDVPFGGFAVFLAFAIAASARRTVRRLTSR